MTNPEDQLIKWANLLKSDGIISIALPCDPGILWRLGQISTMSKAKKIYNY